MDVRFLTPLGALFALSALLPLGALVLGERRLGRVLAALGLQRPARTAPVPLAAALAGVAALLALAAMQPVVETERTVRERTDAEAFVLLDVSRSMLAAADGRAATRLDRAKALAERLRVGLPQVPVGILSLTDRVLPHLFPTVDGTVFASTLERSLGIERPPPERFFSTRATNLDALGGIPPRGFYSAGARKRLLVVLTDGESQAITTDLRAAFARPPRIETLFVHVWEAGEAIFETGIAERGYRADPASAGTLAGVATSLGGVVFGEREEAELAAAARAFLGSGPSRERVVQGERRALMPFVTLAALLPLGFALLRRNL